MVKSGHRDAAFPSIGVARNSLPADSAIEHSLGYTIVEVTDDSPGGGTVLSRDTKYRIQNSGSTPVWFRFDGKDPETDSEGFVVGARPGDQFLAAGEWTVEVGRQSRVRHGNVEGVEASSISITAMYPRQRNVGA